MKVRIRTYELYERNNGGTIRNLICRFINIFILCVESKKKFYQEPKFAVANCFFAFANHLHVKARCASNAVYYESLGTVFVREICKVFY